MSEALITKEMVFALIGILVPIIPAYILYKTLPARSTVKGPFKGLNIQLSGAFAGYFLLVLVVFAYDAAKSPDEAPNQQYEVWTVKGNLSADKREDIPRSQIAISPPTLELLPTGNFSMRIPVTRKQSGELDFPVLFVQLADHLPENVALGKKESAFSRKMYQKVYDEESKEIQLIPQIQLEKAPQFSDEGAQQPIQR